MRKMVLLILTPLAACGTAEPVGPVPAPVDACAPATLGQFTGQPATSELGAAMQRATGKTALRWVRPGMAVTMDYREDRLTVYLDAAGRVERASCG